MIKSDYIIYGSESCVYCLEAKMLLESRGLDFLYLQYGLNYTLDDLMKLGGGRSVPQVVHQGELLGGLDALKEKLSKDTTPEQDKEDKLDFYGLEI